MTDPRGALRAQRARWLLVRNNLRAVAARLAAADHALRRDARRSDDPEMHVLVDALAAQRRCFGEVAVDLDERIAVIEEELRELELAVVQKVVRIAQCARVRFSSRMP